MEAMALVCAGTWMAALKNLPLASQETAAAMEFHHQQLKLRLLNEKDSSVYERADWLVHKLSTKVHSYFWLDECSDKEDFSRYRNEEWVSGLTSWRKALSIPDSSVVIEESRAMVTSQISQDKVHAVLNPGSQFSLCDCSCAEMGNLCEHVIKVVTVFRDRGLAKPSVSLSKFRQALINMLHCTPHDCLVRDHAVSMTLFVQKQLASLIGPQSSNVGTVDGKNQTSGDSLVNTSANEGRDSVADKDQACGGGDLMDADVDVDADVEVDAEVPTTDGLCNEGSQGECSKMETEP